MFGYVRAFKPELKMAEYEHYQAVYCSLCKQLGKRYGVMARMTLSYDFTFLAIFLMAMDDKCTGFKKGRCAFNPLKKRTCCCDNESIAYAADMATLLTYHKVKDNIADKSFFRSIPGRLLLPFAAHARRKAAKLYPELDAMISTCMSRQTALEKDSVASIDAAADSTATILQTLLSERAGDNTDKRVYERLGYCLGRWIYLMDAVDDLEEDLEQGSYNPYVISAGLKKGQTKELEVTRQYALQSLNACLAECAAAYNLLTVRRFDGILRNIVELGLPAIQKQVLTKKG